MKFPAKYLPVKTRKAGKQHNNKQNRTAFPLSLWTSQVREGKRDIFASALFRWERIQAPLSATSSQLNTREVKKGK